MDAGNSLNLKIHPAENGAVLIDVLSNRLGISRNKAKAVIDRRCVFINGRRVWMARHSLKAGDHITGSFSTGKSADIKNANILYEDRDYLVINKPAGILSNGPESLEKKMSGLLNLPDLAACHRLDKDTSGCLIFAKSVKARERIITLFARNEIVKKYEAIIRGRLPEKSITITKPIDGQKAVSRVHWLDSTPVASHVLISIETGRTHQIRKHLASIGHPVLGDQHYGVGRDTPQAERSIGRQMLHAAEIKFIQPMTGRPVNCKSPLPADIKDCLRQYLLK